MRKFIALALALVLALSLAACSSNNGNSGKKEDVNAKSEGVMTYAEYDAAALDSAVVVETYVQGKQSWWDNKATVYTQDGEGGYFLYELACPQDEYDQLVPGTKIKVTGYKSEWSGEVEIVDGTFEIVDGSYVAEPTDVTSLAGKDELVKHQNKKVVFKGMTVEDYGNGQGFAYKNDERGDDVYFKASVNGATVEFCVEMYLTDPETEVYKTVENLKVGDKVDVEGFLYWYEGANPHVTSVKVK